MPFPGIDFGWILDGFGIDIGRNLDGFWMTFRRLLNNFEIPDHFIKIDHIPTTLSGKIKKKYLYKKFKYKYYNNEKN